jgi:hypothetical protein
MDGDKPYTAHELSPHGLGDTSPRSILLSNGRSAKTYNDPKRYKSIVWVSYKSLHAVIGSRATCSTRLGLSAPAAPSACPSRRPQRGLTETWEKRTM